MQKVKAGTELTRAEIEELVKITGHELEGLKAKHPEQCLSLLTAMNTVLEEINQAFRTATNG